MKQKLGWRYRLAVIMVILIFLAWPAGAGQAAHPFVQGYVEGYLKEITLPPAGGEGEAAITVETYGGEIYRLKLSLQAVLAIDQRPAKPADFKPGMEVYARIVNRQATYVEGYSTMVASYLPPGGRVQRGVIIDIEGENLIIKDYAGERRNYYISPATVIMRQGKLITPGLLYPGDRVKLYFDELYSDVVGRMEVEGNSVLVSGLYRGKLASVDTSAENLVLREVYIWRNGRWQSHAGIMQIPYVPEIVPFAGGQKLAENRMPYYRGRDVYIITKNVLGRERAVNVIFKNQYESVFNDKIADINWYADKLELGDKNNFTLHEGSVVIKDGRLQDKMILGSGDDVLIIADGRGLSRLANIIYVYNQSLNNTKNGQYYILAGRLDQVTEYRLWLKDYFVLGGNQWESFRGSRELFFDHDTAFYDGENRILLSADQFIAGDYAVDEESERVKKEGLKDWYAYLYVDGERVVAALLQPKMDSLLVQRVTTGTVHKVVQDELAGWTVEMRDGADFSPARGQWMPRTAFLRVNLEKALLIKEDKLITPEELKTGDRLYMVRDDFFGKVIVVK
ncbi:hypothetical protein SAMN02745221_01624 [Thermosyntropha lipolytica DSM 11003]|uniref:Uncharacterized protein n=1 Tax=Thermosyntropha lipolytica DSM 11003 TaxID=1123382 RepID=A0A1M5PZY2_9FIRM|nr:hypothetical protein [Thermosyntropha lipolytica]SHH07425.1 hypothetical protein SAMN02745221_01624 [Thermosyntropha lipolytica DSM 11003]